MPHRHLRNLPGADQVWRRFFNTTGSSGTGSTRNLCTWRKKCAPRLPDRVDQQHLRDQTGRWMMTSMPQPALHQSALTETGMPQCATHQSAMAQVGMPQSALTESDMQRSILPQYWYVVADARELTQNTVLSRKVLDENLACYRDPEGQVVIAQDRCVHRSASLSSGTVSNGTLTCRYHGWNYGDSGKIVAIPCEGGEEFATKCGMRAKTYRCIEQDGYVYVCLTPGEWRSLDGHK